MGNSPSNPSGTSITPSQPAQAATSDAPKPKPCCVCKDEKALRDECMLFSQGQAPENAECKPLVERYRLCMKGFGFDLPA